MAGAIDIFKRNNVVQRGQGQPTLVFAHGFGCDQQMWRFVAPQFEADHQVLLFDHIGCGRSDTAAYEPGRHSSLRGYAQDVVEIMAAAELSDAVFVGHSVSAMIGLLAAIAAPQHFSRLVMIGPSPRYLNEPPTGYIGGFEREDIDGLIDMMESNMVGWASFLAPQVMGAGSSAEMTRELRESFCASDPYIAHRFAIATFFADNRADLTLAPVPSLVIQCSDDAIAPRAVGEYVHSHLPASTLAVIEASGHCPHMTHPQETAELIRRYLAEH
ncbi:alpha/beta hydrolase [Paucibacter sp. PLA-PC-4]|uniref:alpha/beta fold hydrolase n=1 Tax=Paucibacter sp. PLA-PC-4 TaxID=2993655 RepID=UPI0022492117|nr:alpha/beta hydrolase [Paucibacter sp. PLA-PC-4]MCX2862932.1 alpha/beta hydrolase [Paucibacter sp. PLA-PC-4]